MSRGREAAGFLREFVSRPREVGAIAASSPALGRAVAACVPWSPGGAVVEAGPGDGAITGFLLAEKPKDATFLAVELNPQLASTLAERMPEATVVVGDLGNLPKICGDRGVERVDAVVATLPWSLLSGGKAAGVARRHPGSFGTGRPARLLHLHARPAHLATLAVRPASPGTLRDHRRAADRLAERSPGGGFLLPDSRKRLSQRWIRAEPRHSAPR